MAESLLERSARYIDEGTYEGPRSVPPVDGSFHEIADGLAVVCAFSHVWAPDTDDGLAVFDTSLPAFAPRARGSYADAARSSEAASTPDGVPG